MRPLCKSERCTHKAPRRNPMNKYAGYCVPCMKRISKPVDESKKIREEALYLERTSRVKEGVRSFANRSNASRTSQRLNSRKALGCAMKRKHG